MAKNKVTVLDLKDIVINDTNSVLTAPGIYSIKNKKTGSYYVGQSINIIKRLIEHCNGASDKDDKDAQLIDRAIKNLGIDAFEFRIEITLPPLQLYDKATVKETLNQQEHQYITRYNSYNNGYNKTGGNHQHKFDTEYDNYIKDFHPVTFELFKELKNNVYNMFDNKKILLINNFDIRVINLLRDYLGCYVETIYKSNLTDKELGKFILQKLRGEYYMKLKDFDIIISNPPYDDNGVKITEYIVNNMSDNCKFINLLPDRFYSKSDSLYRHVDIRSWYTTDAFIKQNIAGVMSNICLLNKEADYTLTKEAFFAKTRQDKRFIKYFSQNITRKHSAIDNGCQLPKVKNIPTNRIFILSSWDIRHGHMPFNKKLNAYNEDCGTYQMNVNNITYDEFVQKGKQGIKGFMCFGNDGKEYFGGRAFVFNTAAEKMNFVNFIYNNKVFIDKLFTAANSQDREDYALVLPKVDWTKAWTPEELLKEYNYTNAEIADIMNN